MAENRDEKCSELSKVNPIIMHSANSGDGKVFGPTSKETDNDEKLIELWLHGRPKQTRRAYIRETDRFIDYVQKPLRSVKLVDIQNFADHLSESLKESSLHRALSAVKSLFSKRWV